MQEKGIVARNPTEGTGGFGLLLVQLGFHAAARFNEALAPTGLEPRQAGTLRRLAANEGLSQQALGQALGVNANRMVFLIDDLEEHGLVERRRNPADRRAHALYLTPRGHEALQQAAVATAQHQASLGHSLTRRERDHLTGLLRKLAAEQGINEQGLPGPPPGTRTGENANVARA